MTRSTLLCFCLLTFVALRAQFSFDFNQGEASWPGAFAGQTDHFIINGEQLQLAAPEAGNSLIHTQTHIPDSLEIGIHFNMDFNPSANNLLRIYLQLDTFDLSLASGYFIEIGENGSEDKISFKRIIEGDILTIAEGHPAEFAVGPIDCHLKVFRDQSGLWEVWVKQGDEELFHLDLELFDSTIKRYFDQYFALECVYTSTRTDKFTFDDIYLKERVPDLMPPKLMNYHVLDAQSIQLNFNEILDKSTVLEKAHYLWVEKGIQPSIVHFNEYKPNQVVLKFANSFDSDRSYTLEIKELADLKGNRIPEAFALSFYFPKPLSQEKDLVINEILFNPLADGVDFLELYNASDQILDLDALELLNLSRSEVGVYIEDGPDLFPGDYLLMCSDTAGLYMYDLPEELHYFSLDLPPFNNDSGNITLHCRGVTIDSFDYHEDMHFPLVSDPEGVSLERLSPALESNDKNTWHSASGVVGGATPGKRNSQFRTFEFSKNKTFSLISPVFSPDNDGFEDQLMINYQLEKEGYLATIKVFDAYGQYIRTLVNNSLLGVSGFVTWDGLSESASYLPTGPYLIHCSIFDLEGNRFQQKLLAYLACRK
jgi:hypothetical protein